MFKEASCRARQFFGLRVAEAFYHEADRVVLNGRSSGMSQAGTHAALAERWDREQAVRLVLETVTEVPAANLGDKLTELSQRKGCRRGQIAQEVQS